ncbi:MAG: alanine racemase [Lachnospiraceae bacterium]|nr:alanine racemase [Lachnospiraceae bacterium]
MKKYYRCYAEISLDAIRSNIYQVKKRLPEGVKVLAVIKANGYGHGALKVGACLEDLVDYFAVATIEEAVQLREGGILQPVMILGYTSPKQYMDLIRHDIIPTIYRKEDALLLSRMASHIGRDVKIHFAVDTGMTRIGFQVEPAEADVMAEIAALPHIIAEGMFSHFACADMTDKAFSEQQMEKFEEMIRLLEERGVEIPVKHLCNSAGIMEFDSHRYNMVRSGIITYGLYPSEEVKKENLDLIPAMSWKAHVIHVKEVPAGRGVSYGATYVTEGESTRIATISVGYADGYPRSLSSKGRVLIRGEYAPILGRVCMDQMMVDVSHIPDVQVEDVVTLVGTDQGRSITVEELGELSGSFNYEMVCAVSERVPRIYV